MSKVKFILFLITLGLLAACSKLSPKTLYTPLQKTGESLEAYDAATEINVTLDEKLIQREVSRVIWTAKHGVEGKKISKAKDPRKNYIFQVLMNKKGVFYQQKYYDQTGNWQKAASQEGALDHVLPLSYEDILGLWQDVENKLEGKKTWQDSQVSFQGEDYTLTQAVNQRLRANYKDKPKHQLTFWLADDEKRIVHMEWQVHGKDRVTGKPLETKINIKFTNFNRQEFPQHFAEEEKLNLKKAN